MENTDKNKKIKIIKNGPYIVSGNVPLSESIIIHKGNENEFFEGRELPQSEVYALCRCGKSKNPPFCDVSHEKHSFSGTEKASKTEYSQRIVEKIEGPNLDLLDDGRCAFARFCHRDAGDAWELTENSDIPELRTQAIIAATDCPSGRLVVMDKEGHVIEPDYKPVIEIIQDPPKRVSGPIFVKGYIPIESADGSIYEERNRIALCRCGKSKNKPFCDAAHITAGYKDKRE
ncbi:MAG: iron-binding protein [Eubacteriaceae bacterium]|nr:iron-binding protein [Eubacteriaceae bacterium]